METQNEATKRARTEPIAQDNECHVRQPEQEQHMTISDTQASAEDSDNVDFVPPVLPALAVPAIIHERADFAVYTSFTGEEALHVYDVTVTGVHAESGLAAWHGEDEYTSGFADKGQLLKDKKHSRYEHRGTAHGLAFCSVGSLAEGAAKAINYLYAKDSRGRKRNWDSEPSRIAHKKALLDTLSCVLARHRTLDYMFAGYPCGANGDLVMNNHRPLEQRLRHSPKRRVHPYQGYSNRGINLH